MQFLTRELVMRNILNGEPVFKIKKWNVNRLVNDVEGTSPVMKISPISERSGDG
jgi:hypothetical protein